MNNRFPQLLQELRQSKEVSQARLASDLKYTQSNISCWENGSVEPKATALICIANYFNVSTDYLLGLEDDFGTRTVTPMSDEYTKEERDIIEQYRSLNPACKKLIKDNIKMLTTTTAASEQKKNRL